MNKDNVYKNYEPFYNMVLSTTIMSNSKSKQFEADSRLIIDFIGNAYKLNNDLIVEFKSIILNTLVSLGLTTDQQAVYSNRHFDDSLNDDETMYDIKAEVLSTLQSMSNINNDSFNSEINPSWFDYSHYKTYQPQVRFQTINTTSATGNLIATRQVGILRALGIGCEKDMEEAIKRFSQCVFWGDIPSMFYLAYTYTLINNKTKSEFFYDLAKISNKYLKAGYTVLPDKIKNDYAEEVRMYYVYISSIRQDIIYAYNKFNIDFSFLEAINSDSLSYIQRMQFINRYTDKEWKNVTNSSEKPTNSIGFN